MYLSFKGYDDSKANRAEVNPAPIVLEPGGGQDLEVEHIIEHQHIGCNMGPIVFSEMTWLQHK